MSLLEPGEFAVRRIQAKLTWNRTGLLLKEGGHYELTADPSHQWYDASITTNADGYVSPNLAMSLMEWSRRSPRHRWFALIGAIDAKNATRFLVGTHSSFTATRSGELTCYANDHIAFYWNNRGSVMLRIERTDGG